MDSMGKNTRTSNKYAKYLRNFLERECASKKEKSTLFTAAQIPSFDTEVPVQLNGYDCGIFVLHYVELFLKVNFNCF